MMMMMMSAMRGVRRGLCVVLGLLLLAAACNGKKLWGVDVGKKEEKGEFASLLKKASGEDVVNPARGVADEVGSALAALADVDLSQLSLPELCTGAIDMVLEVIKDEKWIGQFAEPGVIGEIARNAGLAAMLGDDDPSSVGKQDLLELMALESNPILYKNKFNELVEKVTGKLVNLRMDVADPVKLNKMVKELLESAGFDEDTVAQIMEVVSHPEILAEQIKAIASDPEILQQVTAAVEGFMTGMDAASDMSEEEMMEMLAAWEKEDPEMMEEMMAELMKDPAYLEGLAAEGGAESGAGGGFFKGAGGRQAQGVEL